MVVRSWFGAGLVGLVLLGGCVTAGSEGGEPSVGEFAADGGAPTEGDDEVSAAEQSLQAMTYVGVIGGYSTSCFGSVPRPIYSCSAQQVSVYKSGSKTCSRKRSGSYHVQYGFRASTGWSWPFCSG
jgi:hypothetical protein